MPKSSSATVAPASRRQRGDLGGAAGIGEHRRLGELDLQRRGREPGLGGRALDLAADVGALHLARRDVDATGAAAPRGRRASP